MAMASLVLKRFVARGTSQEFMMELPAYRLPSWRTVLWQIYERARSFAVLFVAEFGPRGSPRLLRARVRALRAFIGHFGY